MQLEAGEYYWSGSMLRPIFICL